MVNSWATLFVAILVPVTAALYWSRANRQATWVSMIAGTGTWLAYIIIRGGNLSDVSDSIFYQAATYGGFASLVSYVGVTVILKVEKNTIFPAKDLRKAPRNVTKWHEEMSSSLKDSAEAEDQSREEIVHHEI